jgi:oxygen-independent coproporphyrinogen-3 oxidase
MRTVRNAFNLATDAEISLEANPGTLREEYLSALRQQGVNRLSLGVQSAIPSELALLEREYDFSAAVDAVTISRSARFANLNLDLIYGVPQQTLASWERSLRAVLSLEPQHLSLYCLTIEPGTPMNRWLSAGRISPPDPDLAADQYELACEILAQRGYLHYEISNWALPNHECQHNLTYWRNQAYLGLGAGAHGQAGGYRYHVVKQPRVYIRRMQWNGTSIFPLSSAVTKQHRVDRKEGMADTMITQLRLLQEGLNVTAFQAKFGQTPDEAYKGTVSELIEWGLLHRTDDRLCLTERGRFLSNQVFYRFM